jgi:hypothetical protein
LTTATTNASGGHQALNDRSIFKTAKPQGAYKDEIFVEVNTIDGQEDRATETTKETIKTIFMEELGRESATLSV